jgi:hypothetical protein
MSTVPARYWNAHGSEIRDGRLARHRASRRENLTRRLQPLTARRLRRQG